MDSPPNIACPSCGRGLPEAGAPCSFCSGRRDRGFHARPLVLVGMVVVTAAFFVAVAYLTGLYHRRELQFSHAWFSQGQEALNHHQPQAAIDDLRNALYYSHDNQEYRLQLAEALAAANQTAEAQAHLLNLWSDEPGDGTINLELAHLAARMGRVDDAVRYFHGAIFGVWPEDAAAHRRQARLQLITFLLQRGNKIQADSELIALAADLPPTASAHSQLGSLFLQAGNYNRALDEFQQALRLDATNSAALAGAGRAAFQLALYRTAGNYLRRAISHTPPRSPEAATEEQLLATTKLVLTMDPFTPGLSNWERARRVIDSFHQAEQRLQQCADTHHIDLVQGPVPPNFQDIYQQTRKIEPLMKVHKLSRDPHLVDATMTLVSHIEELTAQACGAPSSSPDMALLLLTRKRQGAER